MNPGKPVYQNQIAKNFQIWTQQIRLEVKKMWEDKKVFTLLKTLSFLVS